MLTCLRLFLYSPTERMTLRNVSSWNWPSSTALTATPPNPPPPRRAGVSPLPPLVSLAAADAHSQPTPVLCAVFIAFRLFPLSSPLAVCVYFFALWCFFFFGLRIFFSFHPLGDGHAWWIGSLIFCSSSCMIDRFYILSPCDGILSFLYISLYLWEERSNKTRNHIQFFV